MDNNAPQTDPSATTVAADCSLAGLLKSPAGFAIGICRDGDLSIFVRAFMTGVAGHALFGLAAGFFAGPLVALMDAIKGVGIAFFAFALCIPSLYVFSCIAGTTLSFVQLLTAGGACLAMSGLLMAALAPVLWLFAVSSASVAFVTVLTFALAFVAAFFALRPAKALMTTGALRSTAGMRIWFAILVVVSLQMVTLLRPMLAVRKPFAEPAKKCFFLTHFFDAISGDDVQREVR